MVMEIAFVHSTPVKQSVTPDELAGLVRQPLEQSAQRLRAISVDEVITAFHGLYKRLADVRNPLHKRYRHLGLSFLLMYIHPDNIRHMLTLALHDVGTLDAVTEVRPGVYLRAEPKRIVGHWLAGNVPFLGLISIFQALFTKNASLVKLSSRAEDYVTPFLEELGNVPGGRTLSDAVIVLRFPGDDQASNLAMARLCNVRLAWGGMEAMASLASLPRDTEGTEIFFGPRYSLSVVDPALLDEEKLNGLATDIVLFTQNACTSPHSIFVKGSREDLRRTAQHLGQAIDKLAQKPFFDSLDAGEASRVLNFRTEGLMRGEELVMSQGTHWTLRLARRADSPVALGARIVHMYAFQDWQEFLPALPPRLQTVSHVLSDTDLFALVEACAPYGVHRFPRVGAAHTYQLPWDGTLVLDQLVRWVGVQPWHR